MALWPGRRLLCPLGEGANTVLMVGGPGEKSTPQALGECPLHGEEMAFLLRYNWVTHRSL